MDLDRIEQLARRGEMNPTICAIRLRAARAAAGLTQKEVAEAVHRRPTTISNMEKGLSYPSFEVMRYFYRQHLIDFNFFMAGDPDHLTAEVLRKLLPALEDATNAWDQKER